MKFIKHMVKDWWREATRKLDELDYDENFHRY